MARSVTLRCGSCPYNLQRLRRCAVNKIVILLYDVAWSYNHIGARGFDGIIGSSRLHRRNRIQATQPQTAAAAVAVGHAIGVFAVVTHGEEQDLGCGGFASNLLTHFDIGLDIGGYAALQGNRAGADIQGGTTGHCAGYQKGRCNQCFFHKTSPCVVTRPSWPRAPRWKRLLMTRSVKV